MPAVGFAEYNLMVLRAECCCGANAAAVHSISAAAIDCLIFTVVRVRLAAEGAPADLARATAHGARRASNHSVC